MDKIVQEAPVRVMGLHSVVYCERLYFLEEVEQLRVADAAVFAGRTLHQELKQSEEEKGEWSSLSLSSELLGLTGKVDALRRRDGQWIPYEHKRGRARREGKKAVAWDSDAVQIAAYGMLLEEKTDTVVAEGRIRYHKDNVTVRVPLDSAMRLRVTEATQRARELRQVVTRPPVTSQEGMCLRCSLAPVCLPEEERLLEREDWQPLRLFPPDLERKNVHVQHYSSRISKSGKTLKISSEDGKSELPIHEIQALVLHGFPQITTQALHLCAYNDIGIHWLSSGGRYLGSFSAGAGGVQRRIRQYQALTREEHRLELAKALIAAKVENSLRYLLRASRGKDRDALGLEQQLNTIRACRRSLNSATDADSLRGYEGLAGKAYFAALPRLLHEDTPEEMIPSGRSRRPPRDRFNALLSFGYSLLYQAVLQAILTVGLEPALGFFHTPRSSAHPLVLDLMELFRVPLWDIALVASVNRMQWDPQADFDIAGDQVWLSREGRKKAIGLFERRLQDTWRHPVVEYSLSYARLLELEVRLLEKEWSGSPGLFARMRLR